MKELGVSGSKDFVAEINYILLNIMKNQLLWFCRREEEEFGKKYEGQDVPIKLYCFLTVLIN